MGDFLSPVDPIFFMHHSNIDRLWDVWTRKQQALALPTLPESGLDRWKTEPFLFYIGKDGKPVATSSSEEMGQAGYYATIGSFNYSYSEGFGEQPQRRSRSEFENQAFTTNLSRKSLRLGQMAVASIDLPEALDNEVHSAQADTELVAQVSLVPTKESAGTVFNVFVNPPAGNRRVSFDDPGFAGTIAPFGGHGHSDSPTTFSIPITEAVRALKKAGRLKENEALDIHIVPESSPDDVQLVPTEIPLANVTVKAL